MNSKYVIWVLSICLMSVTLIFNGQAFGGGLYLSEVNSPVSLGTVGVNNVVNNVGADAAYTNPAGMTGLDFDAISPGVQILLPVNKFKSSVGEGGGTDGGNSADGDAVVIPGLNAVKMLSDKWRLGFAITAPMGAGLDYGDTFVGRYSAVRSVIAGLGISPSVAYKINDKVSLGGGITAIYTNLDLDIAVNRPANLPDGKVSINQIDDWSAQGFLGLTWHITDKLMLGAVYRTKSELELEGDLDIKGAPLINEITGNPNRVRVDFDLAPVYAVGLKYKATDNLSLIVDFDYEEWSEFSNNYISIQGGEITNDVDRKWDDTWHVGAAMLYTLEDERFVTAGVSYDSSPVDDEDRTFDLPVDEQFKIGASYGRKAGERFGYSLGLAYTWLGDGKIDQVSQGVRTKGKFDTNYFVSVGGNVLWRF